MAWRDKHLSLRDEWRTFVKAEQCDVTSLHLASYTIFGKEDEWLFGRLVPTFLWRQA